MSGTVKLIIEIPRIEYEQTCNLTLHNRTFYDEAIRNGTPLDDVMAEIENLNPVDYGSMFSYESHNGAKDMQRDILRILDNIGEAESEDKE